jgi:hypothetical protein
MYLPAACNDWLEPIPSGGDPYTVLVPYWQVLCEVVAPVREDAITSAEWQQAVAALDQEPVPPDGATFVWNARWRLVVGMVWKLLDEDTARRRRRPLHLVRRQGGTDG